MNAATKLAQLNPAEVNTLLKRATAADPFNNAIIAVVDRGGRVLGVRVENGVSPRSPATPTSWSSPSTGPWPRPGPAPSSPTTGAADLADDPGPQPVNDHPARGPVQPEHHRPELDRAGPGLRRPGRDQGPLPARRPVHPPGQPLRDRAHQPRQHPPPGRERPGQEHRQDVTLPSRFNVPGQHPGEHRRRGDRADPARILRARLGARARRPGAGDRHPARRHPDHPDRDGQRRQAPIIVGGIGVFYPGDDRVRHRGELVAQRLPLRSHQARPRVAAELVAAAAVNGSSTRPGRQPVARGSAPSAGSPRSPGSTSSHSAGSTWSGSPSTSSARTATRGRTTPSRRSRRWGSARGPQRRRQPADQQ